VKTDASQQKEDRLTKEKAERRKTEKSWTDICLVISDDIH
jgi:hypothetical protein